MNLVELQDLWKARDWLYGDLERAPLTPAEADAVRAGRKREVEINLEPGERARGWAIANAWVPVK